jgi:hypothetical protein
MLHHHCNLSCRRIFSGCSSISAIPGYDITVDRGSLYAAFLVVEWLTSMKVYGAGTIHTVQLTTLPRPHSRGDHKLPRFSATIATAGLSWVSHIKYPSRCSGPTAAFHPGFICLPTLPKYPQSNSRPLHRDYSNSILYGDLLGWPPPDLIRNRFEHLTMKLQLT